MNYFIVCQYCNLRFFLQNGNKYIYIRYLCGADLVHCRFENSYICTIFFM